MLSMVKNGKETMLLLCFTDVYGTVSQHLA